VGAPGSADGGSSHNDDKCDSVGVVSRRRLLYHYGHGYSVAAFSRAGHGFYRKRSVLAVVDKGGTRKKGNGKRLPSRSLRRLTDLLSLVESHIRPTPHVGDVDVLRQRVLEASPVNPFPLDACR